MDSDPKEASIEWEEYTEHVMLVLREKEALHEERQAPLNVVRSSFKTRLSNPVLRIQQLVTPPRLLTITDVGDITVYDCQMKVSSSLSLLSRGTTFRVNDGMFLANTARIILATTARRLEVYHAISGRHTNTLIAQNVVMCLDYYIDPFDANTSLLCFGDVRGGVGIIRFSGARLSLFGDASQDSFSHDVNDGAIPIGDLPAPYDSAHASAHATYEITTAHHLCRETDEVYDDIVKCVKYAPSVESVISVAGTAQNALSVTNTSSGITHGDVRSAPICKACNHFDYSDERKVILTGGVDTILRLWNPLIMPFPLVTLRGHSEPIVRVQINEIEFQGISISVTEVVKIWDLEERACLNTMMNISDPPRFGSRRPVTTILWHRDTQTAVLAFCSELAMLTIRRDAAKKATVTAHEDPVTKMVYLPAHDVAATGDTSGHLIFWKVGTGDRVREIKRAHLDSPITCMSADPDQNRLLTASEAGEIIMWDAVAGEALKRFVVPNPCEVCSLASLPSGVFTFGGDGRLVKFINHEPVQSDDTLLPEVPPDSSFEPKKFHKSAVTCSAACAGMLLASGDCDGTIIIWHLEFAMSLREFSTTSFREIWSQRVELDSADQDMFPPVARNAPKEVTAVTWMEDRVNLLKNNDHSELHCANLVAASDGGHIAFWSAMDGELLGSFPTLACAGEDDGVGAIAISQCNSRLYTGDTRGDLKVWGIEKFCSAGHDADRPRVQQQWAAHQQPINDIQLLEAQGVLLTASDDCAVRLWNIQGEEHSADYIGAFCATTPGWSLAAYRIAQSLAIAFDHVPKGAHDKKWIKAMRAVVKLNGLKQHSNACELVAAEVHSTAEEADVESVNKMAPEASAGPAVTPTPAMVNADDCRKLVLPGILPDQPAGEAVAGPSESWFSLTERCDSSPSTESQHNTCVSSMSPIDGHDYPGVGPNAKDWLLEHTRGRVHFNGMQDSLDQKTAHRKLGDKPPCMADTDLSKLPRLCRAFSTLRQSSLAPIPDVATPAVVQDAMKVRHGKRVPGSSFSCLMRTGSGSWE